jgi:hypothetical protein
MPGHPLVFEDSLVASLRADEIEAQDLLLRSYGTGWLPSAVPLGCHTAVQKKRAKHDWITTVRQPCYYLIMKKLMKQKYKAPATDW